MKTPFGDRMQQAGLIASAQWSLFSQVIAS
jgi:hypothetical protein